jgi:hypothetical protein
MITLSGGGRRLYCHIEVAGVGDGGNVGFVDSLPFTTAPSRSGRLGFWGHRGLVIVGYHAPPYPYHLCQDA